MKKIAMIVVLLFFFKYVKYAHAQLEKNLSQKTEPDSVNNKQQPTAKDSPQSYPWETDDKDSVNLIDYVHLREADIMWSKRVWRMIDLREKINLPLHYPEERLRYRKSLFHTIVDALNTGELHAYDALDDEFGIELSLSEVREIIVSQNKNSFAQSRRF